MKSKPKDIRSPLAKAKQEWMESEEGFRCRKSGVINQPYLDNRLLAAFDAGAAAAQKRLPRIEAALQSALEYAEEVHDLADHHLDTFIYSRNVGIMQFLKKALRITRRQG